MSFFTLLLLENRVLLQVAYPFPQPPSLKNYRAKKIPSPLLREAHANGLRWVSIENFKREKIYNLFLILRPLSGKKYSVSPHRSNFLFAVPS